LALALLATVATAGCGGGSTGTGPAGEPTASAPEATAPPSDATQPGTTAVTPPTTTGRTPVAPAHKHRSGGAGGGGETGDGGGEQAVRVPASFTVTAGGRLVPSTITVPPFLAVELSIVASDGKPHRLLLRTTPPHALRVGAGARAAVRIRGLRAGRYAVMLDGRRAGALVAGGEVGP
jgi:hypothetical protein